MTDANKPLGIQHAKITGQVMRDHWGPIVERIADEIEDPRDAQICALIAENERLRAAMTEMFPLTDSRESYGEKYYRAIRIARAALEENK